jgi:hypothetical protein
MRPAFRLFHSIRSSTVPLLLVAVLGLALPTGCKSRDTSGFPPVRALQAEMGKLTYEEALQRFGPPANKIELKDRSLIVEWEVGTETPPSFTFGLSPASGSTEPVTGPTVGGGVYHKFRQLQFDAGHRLVLVQDIKR